MEEKILEAAGEERSAAAVIKLSKPFIWEGTTYEELKFDFSTLTGAVANLILDPIFIFTFHWGMMGAAVATVIGQILTAVLSIW